MLDYEITNWVQWRSPDPATCLLSFLEQCFSGRDRKEYREAMQTSNSAPLVFHFLLTS
jgi:hypothetical protein